MSESARRFWDFVGKLRTFGLTAFAYGAGLFPLWLVFEAVSGGGGPRDVWVPYYATYGFLFGLASGRWWVLLFPSLHLAIVDPLVDRIKYPDDVVTYAYDREAEIVAATLGVLIGLAARWLLAKGIRRRRFVRRHRDATVE